MERRPRPDLEVAPEHHRLAIDRDAALAVMHRVRGIGVDEAAVATTGMESAPGSCSCAVTSARKM